MRYQILNQDADLSLIERLLKVRNISDNSTNFLNPTLANYWLDPFLLNDMDCIIDLEHMRFLDSRCRQYFFVRLCVLYRTQQLEDMHQLVNIDEKHQFVVIMMCGDFCRQDIVDA